MDIYIGLVNIKYIQNPLLSWWLNDLVPKRILKHHFQQILLMVTILKMSTAMKLRYVWNISFKEFYLSYEQLPGIYGN